MRRGERIDERFYLHSHWTAQPLQLTYCQGRDEASLPDDSTFLSILDHHPDDVLSLRLNVQRLLSTIRSNAIIKMFATDSEPRYVPLIERAENAVGRRRFCYFLLMGSLLIISFFLGRVSGGKTSGHSFCGSPDSDLGSK